jgi:phage terminase large subunit-like protein
MTELHWLAHLDTKRLRRVVQEISNAEFHELRYHWRLWARSEQLPPVGNWGCWLICAGRGFGKTRTGSEWVREIARTDPDARIALVAASIPEARSIMVEGESGILSCTPDKWKPEFEPSLRRLRWPSGAQAFLYSAGEPESLRGPQHSHAWCDEIAKWDNSADRAIRAWDNMLLGLRLGNLPRVLATTTPRAVPLMRRLADEESSGTVVVTRGSTYSNVANLPQYYIERMRSQYGGTALGRQELDGHLLTEVDGALWSRAILEKLREPFASAQLTRVVVAVDPPASATGDECGIIVAGVGDDGIARVVSDASLARASPERWARAVASVATAWKADRVVAEANQGGSMVESVLRAADCQMPIRLVHASRGKVARAEPVAALYEAGRVRHVGLLARLEDQLCGLMAGGTYEGPGRSPDRADALVWALTELMLGRRGDPRVMQI